MSKGIPAPYGAFHDWEVNFISLCVQNQVIWDLDVQYLALLQTRQIVFQDAWSIVSTGNCTPAERQSLRDAKAEYVELLRPFIQRNIVYNPKVTDAQRVALGVPPRKAPTPVPPPDTVPVIELLPDYVHKMKVYFKQQPDANGETKRAKPEGVKFMELVYNIGTQPSGPEDCAYRELVTRSPQSITFAASDAGKKVYAYSRWVNDRGVAGEYTNVAEFIIP